MLADFKQVVKDKPVRIHPIVSQLVDPAVLEKMKVKPVSEAPITKQGSTSDQWIWAHSAKVKGFIAHPDASCG